METLRLPFLLMRLARIKEWVSKGRIGGALIAVAVAMMFLISANTQIFPILNCEKYSREQSTEQSNAESSRV